MGLQKLNMALLNATGDISSLPVSFGIDWNVIDAVFCLMPFLKGNLNYDFVLCRAEKSIVKHYHIKQSSENAYYYLTEKHQFSTVPELVYYHKHNSAGKYEYLVYSCFI